MSKQIKIGNFVTRAQDNHELLFTVCSTDLIEEKAVLNGYYQRYQVDCPFSELTKTTLEEYNMTPAGIKNLEKEKNFLNKKQ